MKTPISNIYHLLILVSFLLFSSQAKPNSAPYITQKGRPLNIASRGLSSLFPENTLQAFEAALYQGADFIQVDVVYTKQFIPLVMHDPFLTRITNIRDKYQYSPRYDERVYNGVNKTDWWTDNFTLAELGRLAINQELIPTRIHIFDYKFGFTTLDQVIKMVIKFNLQHKGKRNPDNRIAGIIIQAKDPQMYAQLYSKSLPQTILETLKSHNLSTIPQATQSCPIYLQSLDLQSIKYWSAHSELPVNYLLTTTMPFDLEEIALYATGIGYQDKMIWDYFLEQPTWVLGETRRYGMVVHVWGFRDDQLIFQAVSNINMYEIAISMHLDGVITDFCDTYAPIGYMLKRKTATQTKKKESAVIL